MSYSAAVRRAKRRADMAEADTVGYRWKILTWKSQSEKDVISAPAKPAKSRE
jgi:hypothetical protein